MHGTVSADQVNFFGSFKDFVLELKGQEKFVSNLAVSAVRLLTGCYCILLFYWPIPLAHYIKYVQVSA